MEEIIIGALVLSNIFALYGWKNSTDRAIGVKQFWRDQYFKLLHSDKTKKINIK